MLSLIPGCIFAGIAAIGLINEALDEGDPMKTLAMLQNPSAKLTDVDPSVAQHYHDKLLEARREKAHVRHTHNNTLTLLGIVLRLNMMYSETYEEDLASSGYVYILRSLLL